jgi:hemoglobin
MNVNERFMVLSPLKQHADRAAKIPLAVTGIGRDAVREFVAAFYAEVRKDDLVGPVFERIVAENDWPDHIEKITDFWMAVAFGGAAFRGDAMRKHARIKDISPAHFDRWLAVFNRVADDFWPPHIASLLQFRAQQIAKGLLAGVDAAREKNLVQAHELH